MQTSAETMAMRRLGLDQREDRVATIRFLWNLLANSAYMLRKDKKLWRWTTLKCGFKFLFAHDGVLCEFRRDYLKYFDPDFHPWDDDNRYLLESWQAPKAA